MTKKINEIYVSKHITLKVTYRGKTMELSYIVTGVYGSDWQIAASLKSKRYPCKIPYLANIEMLLSNEFPTKKLLKKVNKKP